MLSKTKYDYNISSKLSQVMDDIGVNKKLVMKRRQTFMLNETITTLIDRLIGEDVTTYVLGSQSEGSVTKGLKSDYDILACDNAYNVIQDIHDFQNGKHNYLMVKDNNTTKGYCYLQLIESSQAKTGEGNVFSYPENLVLENTKNHCLVSLKYFNGADIHGPAISTQRENRFDYMDIVIAYPCFSWPRSACDWLQRQGLGRWPTQEMKKDCVSKGFFLAPVGSKISKNPEIEWRISTSIAERCLMFSLNITQLRCYVLMKMIAKSYLTFDDDTKISSFMCKTTLFHCIERSEPGMWREDNLYICVFVCLLQLRFFILSQKCPHFIITENNLMAGQFTGEEQLDLIGTLNILVNTYGLGLFGIQIDNLGKRLKIKLKMIGMMIDSSVQSQKEISEYICFNLNIWFFVNVIQKYKHLSMENRETVTTYIQKLNKVSEKGSELEKKACTFLLPEIYATLGSVLASSNIGQFIPVSHEALSYFEQYPYNSVSTTLKLASVYYCSENLEECGDILRHIESDVEYKKTTLIYPFCQCYPHPHLSTRKFVALCYKDVTEIQPNIGYCVRFHKSEFNCIPHELQYELFRSSKNDMQHRDELDEMWMDLSVVDYLPFLYFLKYKVYRHQKRTKEKRLALAKLTYTCTENAILYHKETALNLLGQCYEDQFDHQEALKCYLSSLLVRKRNNVAVWHICKLLARIMLTKYIC
ncbi:uncharacterized protein LOC132737670 [Ruditapes philippinarum]|uniref:uncharacterized protein LOC132737670 n=1 Tax=Ruditapes philippinarum TaxID=129788 RepID=UPI00295BB539|nr:uncharacterized protein LOC132737670 [Ruditapes philippinarum]